MPEKLSVILSKKTSIFKRVARGQQWRRLQYRIEAATKRSFVDELRNRYRPELEARIWSALD